MKQKWKTGFRGVLMKLKFFLKESQQQQRPQLFNNTIHDIVDLMMQQKFPLINKVILVNLIMRMIMIQLFLWDLKLFHWRKIKKRNQKSV